MERYWPRYAGRRGWKEGDGFSHAHEGIRYEYGDLNDVVRQLASKPHTRQAYLPIFFPEDTGAVHGERVPCTLGYHFILRNGELHIVYYIRSCDAVRHFRNDVYMTARLLQWVLSQLHDTDLNEDHPWQEVEPGTLTMHITSFHCFDAERKWLRRQLEQTLQR
jgi:thymidylate synthase